MSVPRPPARPPARQAPDATCYDAAGLEALLAALSDFDAAMNGPVEECGILRGEGRQEGRVGVAFVIS